MPTICILHLPLTGGRDACDVFRCSFPDPSPTLQMASIILVQVMTFNICGMQCALHTNDAHSVLLLYCLSKAAVLFGVRLQVTIWHASSMCWGPREDPVRGMVVGVPHQLAGHVCDRSPTLVPQSRSQRCRLNAGG